MAARMMPAMGNGAMDRVRRVEPAERLAAPKEEMAAGDSGAAGERASTVRGGCAGHDELDTTGCLCRQADPFS